MTHRTRQSLGIGSVAVEKLHEARLALERDRHLKVLLQGLRQGSCGNLEHSLLPRFHADHPVLEPLNCLALADRHCEALARLRARRMSGTQTRGEKVHKAVMCGQ